MDVVLTNLLGILLGVENHQTKAVQGPKIVASKANNQPHLMPRPVAPTE